MYNFRPIQYRLKSQLVRFVVVLMLLWQVSCESSVNVQPLMVLTDENSITNAASANEALIGLYGTLQLFGNYGVYQVLVPDLMSDVATATSSIPDYIQLDNHQVQPINIFIQDLWTHPYRSIYVANQLISRVPNVAGIPVSTVNSIVAQAKFVRALAHFNLVKLFGEVPLITTTDLNQIQTSPRIPTDQVLNAVIADLTEATVNLPERQPAVGSFSSVQASRAMATKAAASAFLARVYLYRGDSQRTIEECNKVINNNFFQLEPNYSAAFRGFSSETILEIAFSQNDASRLNLETSPQGQFNFGTSRTLINAIEPNDQRRSLLAIPVTGRDAHYTTKFATPSSPAIVLRLADVYLMRAEALARTGNLTAALQDLNLIRRRAGLSNRTLTSQAEILLAIEQERFIELAFEGHRFSDLVRTNRADVVLRADKPSWQSRSKLLPIPFLEITKGLPQNPGY